VRLKVYILSAGQMVSHSTTCGSYVEKKCVVLLSSELIRCHLALRATFSL
jgi:hypothetical protein